jgi:hypothetical protein
MEETMPVKRTFELALAFIALLSLSALAQAAAPLVSPVWLKQHLNDKNIVIIDVYDGNQRPSPPVIFPARSSRTFSMTAGASRSARYPACCRQSKRPRN